MRYFPLRESTDLFSLAQRWSRSGALTRLLVLARTSGCSGVAEFEEVRCAEWEQEHRAVFSEFGDRITGQPRLLVFVDVDIPAGSEGGVLEAIAAGNVRAYAVVRPQPLGSVAESMLLLLPRTNEHYLTSRCEHSVDFRPSDGQWRTIAVQGLPFMQQDGVASRCAHASLWLATKLARTAFPACADCDVLTFDRVAEALGMAPSALAHRLPSGLRLDEMVRALEKAGYVTHLLAFQTEQQTERADQTVYRYVESHMPAILLLRLEGGTGHTAVVCGHTFDPDAWWPGAREVYFPRLAGRDPWLCSALWTPEYLLLDDNYGPALAITRGGIRNRTTAVIVPIPRSANIFTYAEDAEKIAAGVVFSPPVREIVASTANSFPNLWTSRLQGAVGLGTEKLVLRTLLVGREELRSDIAAQHGYSSQARQAIDALVLPEWVWLVEVSLPNLYGSKLKLGEIFIDPLPRPVSRPQVLGSHLSGWVWAPMGPGTGPAPAGHERPASLLRAGPG